MSTIPVEGAVDYVSKLRALTDWLNDHLPLASRYLVPFSYDTLSVAVFPGWVDSFLWRSCKLDFVLEALADEYSLDDDEDLAIDMGDVLDVFKLLAGDLFEIDPNEFFSFAQREDFDQTSGWVFPQEFISDAYTCFLLGGTKED